MRPLEIALVLVNLVVLISGMLFHRPLRTVLLWLRLVAMAILGAHLVLDGWRWSMVPAYFVTAAMAISMVWNVACPSPRPFIRNWRFWTGHVSGIMLLGFANLFSLLLPVFKFPAPTGAFRIGTFSLHLVDESRPETLSGQTNEHREIMVQFWYPANPAPDSRPQRYLANLDGAEGKFGALAYGLRYQQLRLVSTHSIPDAPVLTGSEKFPVIIFSPSWGGSRNQNTAQAEELASNGFVVVGIDHPYGSGITVFPDGRVVLSKPENDLKFNTDDGVRRFQTQAMEQLAVRTQDARFLLDKLTAMNTAPSKSPLADRLDLSRVGIFGHSFGGAVAAEACCLDPRFKAGINLDGILFGNATQKPLNHQPFMIMNSDEAMPSAEQAAKSSSARLFVESARVQDAFLKRNGGLNLTISGAQHWNFADAALFSPFRRLSGGGRINRYRCSKIVNAYTLAFFRKHLEGQPEPLLEGPAKDFPEVQLEIFPKAP